MFIPFDQDECLYAILSVVANLLVFLALHFKEKKREQQSHTDFCMWNTCGYCICSQRAYPRNHSDSGRL